MNRLQDIHYHRERGYTLPLPARPGLVCEQCGSGEVHQPGQTMDMPMWVRCLRCGNRWVPGDNQL